LNLYPKEPSLSMYANALNVSLLVVQQIPLSTYLLNTKSKIITN